jgi:hypothetical protein
MQLLGLLLLQMLRSRGSAAVPLANLPSSSSSSRDHQQQDYRYRPVAVVLQQLLVLARVPTSVAAAAVLAMVAV